MSTNPSPYLQVCRPSNYIRSTQYSDIYRTVVNMAGQPKEVDIEHIHIPLSEARQKELLKHIQPGEINQYMKDLAFTIKNNVLFAQKIQTDASFLGNDASARGMELVNYAHQVLCENPEDGSKDIFFIMDPITRYLSSEYCANEQMTLRTALFLMRRTLTLISHLNAANAHLGVLDLNTIGLRRYYDLNASPESKEPRVKEYAVMTSFLYARYEAEKNIIPYPSVMPFNTHPSLLKEARPTLLTDLYSWAAVFLTVLNGTYNTDTQAPDLAPPDSVPRDIVDILYRLYNGEAVKSLTDIMTPIRHALGSKEPSQIVLPVKTGNYSYGILDERDQAAASGNTSTPQPRPAPVPESRPAPPAPAKPAAPDVPPAEKKPESAPVAPPVPEPEIMELDGDWEEIVPVPVDDMIEELDGEWEEVLG